jgi:hypothetical protein
VRRRIRKSRILEFKNGEASPAFLDTGFWNSRILFPVEDAGLPRYVDECKREGGVRRRIREFENSRIQEWGTTSGALGFSDSRILEF